MQIQCPNCKTIVAKGFDELAMVAMDFSFQIRCHKCQENLDFTVRAVRIERSVELVPKGMRLKPPSLPAHTTDDGDGRVFVSE